MRGHGEIARSSSLAAAEPPRAQPRSDWATLEGAAKVLAELDISHEVKVVSAHRTPVLLQEFATGAEARGIAGLFDASCSLCSLDRGLCTTQRGTRICSLTAGGRSPLMGPRVVPESRI